MFVIQGTVFIVVRCLLSEVSHILYGLLLLYRATNTLLAKGYMELEETLLQWKQKSHVLRLLEVNYDAFLIFVMFIYYIL